MRTTLIRFAAALALVAGVATSAPVLAQDDAQLSVLHGVPGLTVNVCVNGSVAIPTFAPGALAGPLALPAGTYTVAVFDVTTFTDCSGTPAIGPIDLPLAAGMNYTAVAHLDATGAATASLFENDTSAAGAGEGKATVRHTAANAEGVEIVVNGSISLGTFNNGGQLGPVALAAGTYSAEIKAGTVTVPPTPADVPVTEAQNTIVYAWGDAAGGSVNLAVQVVDLAAPPSYDTVPSSVPTLGTMGLIVMIIAMLGIGLLGVRRLF
jgi:hypothetical protein